MASTQSSSDYKTYLFYDIMAYPLPRQKEFFGYGVGKEPRGIGYVQSPTRSKSKMNDRLEEYCVFVTKRQRVWKHIPFIEAVYLANSITFNALHEESDIDLFIVTNVKRLRRGRLCSLLVITLLRLKRSSKKFAKKFCLSFTVSRNAVNMQELKLNPYDPYLIYRLAHLVPIYNEFDEYPLNIYKENSWIRFYLPNHPLEQVIDLGIPQKTGVSFFRKHFEKLFSGYIGDFFEWVIKIIRLPILLWKRKRLGTIGESCIISDSMLKFHYDKRKIYALKWKLAQKVQK